MPCCVVLFILTLGPRMAIFAIALFSDYISRVFPGGMLLPLLGWIFLPWTTLAYAWAINSRGEVAGFQLVVVVLAMLVDLGIVGGGAAKHKYRDLK